MMDMKVREKTEKVSSVALQIALWQNNDSSVCGLPNPFLILGAIIDAQSLNQPSAYVCTDGGKCLSTLYSVHHWQAPPPEKTPFVWLTLIWWAVKTGSVGVGSALPSYLQQRQAAPDRRACPWLLIPMPLHLEGKNKSWSLWKEMAKIIIDKMAATK